MLIELAHVGPSPDLSCRSDPAGAAYDRGDAQRGSFLDLLGPLTGGDATGQRNVDGADQDAGRSRPATGDDSFEEGEAAPMATMAATAAPVVATTPASPPPREGPEAAGQRPGAQFPTVPFALAPQHLQVASQAPNPPNMEDSLKLPLGLLIPAEGAAPSHPVTTEAQSTPGSRPSAGRPNLGGPGNFDPTALTPAAAEALSGASVRAARDVELAGANRPSVAAEYLAQFVTVDHQAAIGDAAVASPGSLAGQQVAAFDDLGAGARHEGRGQDHSRHAQPWVTLPPTLPSGPVKGQAVEPALPANVGVPPETPTPTSVPGQVIRAITLQWRQGVGEARIQLQPEHLGHVTVNLRVEGGTVTATLRAETQAVSDQIQAQQHQLRTALEQQGLTLGRLLVRIDPEARRQQRAPWHDEPPRRPRHAAVTTTPLFEIEV